MAQLNLSDPGLTVVAGEDALDGSNPTPVFTGLKTVVAFKAELKRTTAPALTTSVLTHESSPGLSTGVVNVYAWRPTSAGDCTLVASTGTETIQWIAVGRT